MAATKHNPSRLQETRDKIRASQLINRLQDHVHDRVELSATQITAALGLLRKVLPDLKAVELAVAPQDSEAQEVRTYLDALFTTAPVARRLRGVPLRSGFLAVLCDLPVVA